MTMREKLEQVAATLSEFAHKHIRVTMGVWQEDSTPEDFEALRAQLGDPPVRRVLYEYEDGSPSHVISSFDVEIGRVTFSAQRSSYPTERDRPTEEPRANGRLFKTTTVGGAS